MCVYMPYVSVYTCVYMWLHMCIYVCMYVFICVYTCVYVCVAFPESSSPVYCVLSRDRKFKATLHTFEPAVPHQSPEAMTT